MRLVTGINPYQVVAIIVSYFPTLDVLRELINAVSQQVHHVLIVDNGSPENTGKQINALTRSGIHYLPLYENRGIGAAQNAGIAWAISKGATHVLLLDQDSLPQPGMVSELLDVHKTLNERGLKVSAVGPRYRDNVNDCLSNFVRFGWVGFARVRCHELERFVSADFLISSGALIDIDTISSVGVMDDSLFIDHVDTEWFLRARSMGFHAFGACRAVMVHNLGEKRRLLWALGWRIVPSHAPFRYYYIFRNSILLLKRDYVGRGWRRCELFRLIKLFIMFGIFVSPRIKHLRMMMLGLRDGLRGRSGCL